MIPSYLKSLLWLEWRRNRWMILLGLIWATMATSISLASADIYQHSDLLVSFKYQLMYLGFAAPILLAMRNSLQDTTEQTAAFNAALPVSWAVFVAFRLVGGLAVLAVCILAAATMLSIVISATDWGLLLSQPAIVPSTQPVTAEFTAFTATKSIFLVAILSLAIAQSLYLYLMVIGVAFSDESHLGYAGMLTAVLWISGYSVSYPLILGLPIFQAILPQSIMPLYQVTYRNSDIVGANIGVVLLLNMVVQLICCLLIVWAKSRRWMFTIPAFWQQPHHGFSLPFIGRGSTLALAWLAMRQALPACLTGLLLAVSLSGILSAIVVGSENQKLDFAGEFRIYAPRFPLVMGTLWAAVVGISLFMTEVETRGGDARQALPLGRGRLFLFKFVLGALCVSLCMNGPALVSWLLFPGDLQGIPANPWLELGIVTQVQLIIFTIAVMWTCVLRSSVAAALATAVTCFGSALLMSWLRVVTVFTFPGEVAREYVPPDVALTYLASLLVFFFVPLLLAWRAMTSYPAVDLRQVRTRLRGL